MKTIQTSFNLVVQHEVIIIRQDHLHVSIQVIFSEIKEKNFQIDYSYNILKEKKKKKTRENLFQFVSLLFGFFVSESP